MGNVPFAIGLLWNSSNDLDLYVNQPDATDVYFGRTSDSDSGATFGGDVRGGSNSMEYIKWTRPDTGRYDGSHRRRNILSVLNLILVFLNHRYKLIVTIG